MANYHKFHMISPPLFIFSGHEGNTVCHAVFGWRETKANGELEPIVSNPDGPGIGPWRLYHGEDPWRTG